MNVMLRKNHRYIMAIFFSKTNWKSALVSTTSRDFISHGHQEYDPVERAMFSFVRVACGCWVFSL
jgi:hypothetical protein